MEILIYIWIIAFAAFVIVEFATSMALVSIWFALGSIVGLIFSLFDLPFWVQITGFLVVSIILIISTRPIAKKLEKRRVDTNAKLDIGKTAIVIDEIDNNIKRGRVRLNGVDWIAISEDNEKIGINTPVTITRIEGTKLYVKK